MTEILVVYKKSTYELESNSADPLVREQFQKKDVQKLYASHLRQEQTLEQVLDALQGMPHDVIYRAELEHHHNAGLIVSVGGDGTFLEVSRYAGQIPVLGVNSDPYLSKGIFCATTGDAFAHVLHEYIDGRYPMTSLNRIALNIDGKDIPEQALNEIQASHKVPPAAMYITVNGQESRHIGLLACTSAGSTGRMFSEGGDIMAPEDTRLQYRILSSRNFAPIYTNEIIAVSHCNEGRVYIDGQHISYDFPVGSVLRARPGDPLHMVGDLMENRMKVPQFKEFIVSNPHLFKSAQL